MAKAIRIENIVFEPATGTRSATFHGTLTITGPSGMTERRVSAPGHPSWSASQIFSALADRLAA